MTTDATGRSAEVELTDNVGKKCRKTAFNPGKEPKPFKSGSKVNTIKVVIVHPQLGIPAYTFEEDDSYVECRRCEMVA